MSAQGLFFSAIASALLWAGIYFAGRFVVETDHVGALVLGIAVLATLAWGFRKEFAS